MIAANGVMVKFIKKLGSPVQQRIVRKPKHCDRIREIARDLGYRLPVVPHPQPLSDFLQSQLKARPDTYPDLSLTVIKLLGQGEYTVVLPGSKGEGHFGLAVEDYTHSTAPNRRYVDLIMQRLVKAALAKADVPYTKGELAAIAAWCSERDQMGKKVERFMSKIASAMFLENRVGEEFTAIVTGISESGTFVRLKTPPVEGKLMRGAEGLAVGEHVEVRLMSVNPGRGFIDFERRWKPSPIGGPTLSLPRPFSKSRKRLRKFKSRPKR
jgi:exoribonuclease-2